MYLIKYLLVLSTALIVTFSIKVYNIFIKTDPSPIVQLKDGKVQGIIMKSREGREFYAFLGIPFAKPPVGSLRFQSPVQTEPWDGIWDASFNRPMCAQLDFLLTGYKFGSEDCLYLNVFVPTNIPDGASFPVMAYIHGGYFHMGGAILAGPHKFMDHDVIIVSLSYRLGALGFLNTDDGFVRGNMGLKDQNLGLKWIQENIKMFGGDKSKVTLNGESGGAASVQYHMLSFSSKGLFSKAIRQSGSALNYWSIYRNNKLQAQRFSRKMNCPVETSEVMVECLRALDVQSLLEGHRELTEHPFPLIAKFAPSIEVVKDADSFLVEEPLALLKRGEFNAVPVLSGYCSDEGLMHSSVLFSNETKLDEVYDWFSWAPRAFHYDPTRRDISRKLKQHYSLPQARNLSSREFIRNLTNLYGDRLIHLGIFQSAMLEKKHAPTYMYFYEHEGGYNSGALLAASQSRIHPIVELIANRFRFIYATLFLGKEFKHDIPGTGHVDEFPLLWGGPMQNALLLTVKDNELSKDLVKLYVDFVSDRKPLKFRDVEFARSRSNESLKFLHIKYDDPKMINEPYQERRKFWETISLPLE